MGSEMCIRDRPYCLLYHVSNLDFPHESASEMSETESQTERKPHPLGHWVRNPNLSHSEGHSSAGSFIRELVFGANDGLVSNVSLVAGVAGATSDPNTVLLAGIAGIVAGAISMGLGAYVSTKSEREFRESEERRERWEIDNMPAEERAEIRQIFQERGISGPTLDAVVTQITKDKDQWVRTMTVSYTHLTLPTKA